MNVHFADKWESQEIEEMRGIQRAGWLAKNVTERVPTHRQKKRSCYICRISSKHPLLKSACCVVYIHPRWQPLSIVMVVLLSQGTSWPTCANRKANRMIGTAYRLASIGRRKTPDRDAHTQVDVQHSSKSSNKHTLPHPLHYNKMYIQVSSDKTLMWHNFLPPQSG